ncbi:low molecular weight protein-tyrosine-phosphatase [Marinicella sediminis]|uniref:protein-tyrosine-phosphatase n=1 Tax=Marinicella sediminis TaxID=1792834 RepID=A0ABV7JEC9_9GAMM|nr:low molecular weight protein-tyrosine-phosphatase [Marinicella sediminis]
MKKILFVCYGNICRSPAAEGIFNHLVANSDQLILAAADSAGTHDFHVGKHPDVRSVKAAARMGINLTDLRASQVCAQDFHDYDWLVAMDQHNIECLREIGPQSQWHKILPMADFHPNPNYQFVPDPFRGDRDDFDLMFESMWTMVGRMLELLAEQPVAEIEYV